MARSRFIREAVRYNGSVGLVDLEDAILNVEGREADETPFIQASPSRKAFLETLRKDPEVIELYGDPEKCFELVNLRLLEAGHRELSEYEKRRTPERPLVL